MDGLMMNYELTLPPILERAGTLFKDTEIVSLLPGKVEHRYTYGEYYQRTRKLAQALQKLGMKKGDRVATLAWNHYRHLESYFGIICGGGVLHTLNLRLHPGDISYIAKDAGDKYVIVDDVLYELLEDVIKDYQFEKIIVIRHDDKPLPEGTLDYEELLATATDENWDYPEFSENDALGICYTSGTTGRPKGVVYSHRGTVMHSFASCMVDCNAIANSDSILSIVPLFHANGWGIPFAALMVGAKYVFPGPFLDAVTTLDLLDKEQITLAAGVPTIWSGILGELTKNPGKWKLTPGCRAACGGSAPPESLILGLAEHGLRVMQAWGMTELSPLGTFGYLKHSLKRLPEKEQVTYLTKQGLPLPYVECRVVSDDGVAPWDEKTMGELQVRGPWVASGYMNGADPDKWTSDGWFRTGDIAVIDPEGYVKLTDRTKDVIKSGGEWISSVDLENALVAHPDVREAAVIAIVHPKWDERPLAVIVPEEGKKPSKEELNEFIKDKFAKWWLPEAYTYVDEIPHTSTGKIQKLKLREMFKDWKW